MFRCLRVYGVSLVLIFLIGCVSAPILFSPLPDQIETIAGYASLRITGPQGSGRTKFSFLFRVPDQGRIEASDFLGRSLYLIIIGKEEAFFAVPSKKAYWKGEEEEIIEKFLGFRLSLDEMIFFLSGQWWGIKDQGESKDWMEEWILEKDAEGRIKRGLRGMLRVEVKGFIKNAPYAHTIVFDHSSNEGSLKVLRLGFNQPYKNTSFSTSFLERFEQKTWEEIQELIRNAY